MTQYSTSFTWYLDQTAIRSHFTLPPLPYPLLSSPPTQLSSGHCHLDSPLFGNSASSSERIQFQLRLYPTGPEVVHPPGPRSTGSLFVALAGGTEDEVQVRVTAIVANWLTGSSDIFVVEGNLGKNLSGQEQLLGWSNQFIWLDHLLNRNGGRTVEKFPIKCQITYTPLTDRPLPKLSTDLHSLRIHPRFADVILVTSTAEFPVHRAILSARSAVFEAMFAEDRFLTTERIEITDVSAQVMEIFLEHIYTGQTTGLDQYALELLEVADKYAVPSLLRVCTDYVLRSLTPETAVSIFALADAHALIELKTETIAFINAHVTEIMKSEAWRLIIEPQEHLIEQLDVDLSRTAISTQS